MKTNKNKSIAFIGLGQMGSGMAALLVKSAVSLLVLDLDPEKVTQLESLGATDAKDIETIREKCEIVFICLPDEHYVQDLLFKESGLLSSQSNIKIIVDTSTISFSKAQSFSLRAQSVGVEYCDCPVSGLPKRSWDGTLTMMFGGPPETFNDVKPYLDLMGNDILHCGTAGSGQMTKAINNIIYNINIAGLCEVLPIAVKAGLDPSLLEELVLGGSSRSFASEHFVPRIMQRKFDYDYPMALAFKDIANIKDITQSFNVETPLVNAMTGIYERTLAEGHGAEPKSAMIKIYENELDVIVRKP
jgi:3-hydroxyisobutyrate dehydrogenase-like beta-hydroxyacid dehydrogenase